MMNKLPPDVSREVALQTRPGDALMPHPTWNQTSGDGRRLEEPTPILDVDHSSRSKSGVSYLVRYANGREVWIDAMWFVHPEPGAATGEMIQLGDDDASLA